MMGYDPASTYFNKAETKITKANAASLKEIWTADLGGTVYSAPLQVGDTIWYFDTNRRVYPPPEPGRIWASGGPIWREHWRPVQITGETSRSWVLGSGCWIVGKVVTKIPKRGDDPLRKHFAFTREELDQRIAKYEGGDRTGEPF